MLKALRQHPLWVGMAELIADAVRYIAIVLIVLGFNLMGDGVRDMFAAEES